MNIYSSRPVVLCLSGHDPSGGAGLQADIEALLAQGCHAAPAVTALTVQNTVNVSDFRVLDREWVLAQANAVLGDSEVAAVKLGMLGSLEMVDTVVELLKAHPPRPVVCDPVLRAGGGGSLGKDEVGYAMRERLLPLSLIAMDIDDFKPINDQHGHAVGDETLVHVVQRLEACLRHGDLLARWGGDEFMVIVPKSTLETARKLAEQMRCALKELPAVGNFKVTLSLGVVERSIGESPTSLMARADQALYRSKAAGKDTVSE